jgi:hypothetical protein
MRHRSGFSAGPGARACRLDMAAAGFCGWNALAADVKVQSLVTAALPPVFRPSRSERGLWSLRLPDVKPPCILAPGLSPGAIFSPRNQIHCSSIAGPTRWFASRAASSVTSNSRCAHAPCPAVRHHALGQPPAARSARWWRGRRRRPPEDRDAGLVQFVQPHPKGTPARPAPAVPAPALPDPRCGRTCRRSSDGRAPATRPTTRAGRWDRDQAWRE